jgi:hypothetical protein
MVKDYHFKVFGDDIELGILTNDEQAIEAFKRDHPDCNGQPVSRPENGHALEFYIQQGKVAASVHLQYRKSYIISPLSYFRRGGPWDEQRLDGRVDGRFVDYATIAIGAYAAAAGLAVRDILELEDFIARSSKFGNDTVFSLDFPHLPVRNVFNTETGYDLFNENRDVE